MSSFPEHGRDWIELSWETARILLMIKNPSLKEKFINDVESKLSNSTQAEVLKYYGKLDEKTVLGLYQITPDTLSAAMEGRSRGNGGSQAGGSRARGSQAPGSQAGASHNQMSTEFVGPTWHSKLHLIPYLLQIHTNVSYNGRL